MLKLVESRFLSLDPYVPGLSIDNTSSVTSWAKLGSNENCLGPSPYALEAVNKSLKSIHIYPNLKRRELVAEICRYLGNYNIKTSNLALGNGTSELIINLVRGLLSSHQAVLYAWPSFVMYKIAARIHGCQEKAIKLKSDMTFDLDAMLDAVRYTNYAPVKLVFLPNPNNPTGDYINNNKLDYFIAHLPEDIVLVVDEAYFEYVTKKDYSSAMKYALSRPRTVVLRTFSKAYGLAGLRIGFAVGDENIINLLCRIRDPFNVNIIAQSAALAALQDHEHVQRSIEHNNLFLPKLRRSLDDLGFVTYPSVGNFLMLKPNLAMPDITKIAQALYRKGVVIRTLKDFGLEHHARVSVGTAQEIAQLLEGLREIL
jgi:histidinol-phosphate aminotransferase